MMNGLTSKIEFKPYKIADLLFSWDDNQYNYNPKPDVTNYELAMLMKMVAYGCIGGRHYVSYDYGAFVAENNLERHFDKVKK